MTDRAALHDRFTAALDARTPVAVATVVRGPGIGSKLLQLPGERLGSLGGADLDETVAADALALLEAEKSETRAYPAAR
jgi:xanthine dehydrogenase accessory factor